ncbi:MAG: flagellar biosynthesis anti-sigma factor FlgM [Myxococcales bacterium]|nr:flagellar biosynthesis anti-sigma factor FlgM [Myxococcales bacterium]
MKGTGRLTTRRAPAGNKADFLATQSGEDVARAARVEDLRRMVASGRYRVEPDRLAERILRRALARKPRED